MIPFLTEMLHQYEAEISPLLTGFPKFDSLADR